MLRKITLSDAEDMFEYACRSDVTEFLLWDPHPSYSYTVELIRHLQRGYTEEKYFDFALELKEAGKMIGTAGFTSFDRKNNCAEAGYVINPLYRNRGYATEALSAIMNISFLSLGINRLEARYMVGNLASKRVMEKCGMNYEGVLRQKLFVKGKFCDIGICSALREDYFSLPGKSVITENSLLGGLSRLFHKN